VKTDTVFKAVFCPQTTPPVPSPTPVSYAPLRTTPPPVITLPPTDTPVPETVAPEPVEKHEVPNLTEDGWVLFYRPTCPYCREQFEILGDYADQVKTVNCNEMPMTCQLYGVRRIPTWLWLVNGTEKRRLEGVQNQGKLKRVGVV